MQSDGANIPTIQSDAKLVGEKHCFDSWREVVRDIYDVEPLTEGRSDQEMIKAWLLNGLIFSEVGFSPQTFAHDSRHTENANYMSLQIYQKGSTRGIFNDESFEVLPGEVHIFDFSREFYTTTEESIVDGVVFSHESVGYDPAYHPAHMKFEVNSVAAQFLRGVHYSLKNSLPNVRREDAGMLAKGFCGLIRSYIAPVPAVEARTRALRQERYAEIKRYVDRHLSNLDLDSVHICNEFNMSRSSLYRCFAKTGGVGQYISQRRLERAFYQLLSTQPSRGRIREVAAHCGYDDASYFSRVFRRRFGVSPSNMGLKREHSANLSRPILINDGPQLDPQLGLWLNSI